MSPSLINLNLNKTIESKKGWVKNKSDKKSVEITGKSFEAQNFDFEKETNRVIEEMKNINRKKLRLDEITKKEGKLDQLFSSDKLNDLLKEVIEIKNDSNIYKILEINVFLSNIIFSNISKLSLTEEIP